MLVVAMELRHLRYFIAVAREENVSRAALGLHVSQPALSRQIRDLEDELGFPLLERSAKAVRLTEAGATFAAEALAVLQRADAAVAAARTVATGGQGELHVGYAPSPTVRFLSPTLRAFQALSPNVRVLLHDLSTQEMLAGLRNETLQLAFLVRPRRAMLRGLRFEQLARDALCLAVPHKHPLARRKTVRLADAGREPLVTYSRKEYPEYHESLAELFATLKASPRIAEEHDGINSVISAVEAGGGVALLSESAACLAGPRIKFIPLSPAATQFVVGAAWLPKALLPAAEAFLQCARKVTQSDLQPDRRHN